MFKQLAGMASLLKDAHKIPEVMQRVQERLKSESIVGEAGGGAVRIEVNGIGETQDVRLAPALLAANDLGAVEQLLKDAFNSANQQARQRLVAVMQQAAQDLNLQLPGINDLISQMAGGKEVLGDRRP